MPAQTACENIQCAEESSHQTPSPLNRVPGGASANPTWIESRLILLMRAGESVESIRLADSAGQWQGSQRVL